MTSQVHIKKKEHDSATILALPMRELFCGECGYMLRGIASERCPECGSVIDWGALAESQIPWVHRAKIGRVRAYLRTAWLATLRPKKLAMEVAGPVSYPDARRFWLVTVAVAYVSLAAPTAAGHLLFDWSFAIRGVSGALFDFWGTWPPATNRSAWAADLVLPVFLGASLLPVALLALLAFVLLATGAVSWFFHPRALPVVRQNRAVALSCYACGPLAFTPVVLLAVGLAVAAGGTMDEMDLLTGPAGMMLLVVILAIIWGLPLAVLVAYYSTILRLLHGATAGEGRVWLAAVGLPVAWVVIAVLTLAGVPWVAGFFRLVIASLA